MDFLKTLMLYMTMTLAASVQGAPVPEATPTPTVAPTAQVETVMPEQPTQTPGPGITVIPTTAATQTPAPKPTITPNPSYRNLEKGDRGDRVKKLQARLIELGYLTGEADGAFGNQTRRAVLRFQYYNGLQQDGVAGRATQTILYESEDVVANPEAVTPTPDPTDTPAPATDAPAPASGTPDDASTIALPEELPLAEVEKPVALTTLEDASVVLNDGGAPLTLLRQEDGVTVNARPRVYLSDEGDVYLSLAELCAAVPEWTLTAEDGAWTLGLEGYDASITEVSVGFAASVDGAPLALESGEVLMHDGELVIRASFLEKAFHAQTVFDDEEETLMIRVQPKDVAGAEG